MNKKEMEKLITKYQQRADAAELTYQETGIPRYFTTYRTNQNLADALRMALSAKADHDTLRDIKMVLSNFASRGAMAVNQFQPEDERVKLAMTLAKEIAEYGQRNGLI